MSREDARPLTDSQREIMEIVWGRGEVTVSEIREALSGSRDLARNTVQTLVVRLEEKGWLKHREEGRKFIYSAARAKSVSLGARVVQMIDRLFSGSPEQMVSALIEYRGLSAEEAERIRATIDQAEATELNARRRQGKKS
jgi:predicted transcriptional regulator